MRFGVCFCICMSLAATSLSNVAEFSQTRDVPFDVVLDVSYDQQRVLLENSELHRIRNADLFWARLFADGSPSLEQVAPRLRPLSTLFAVLSHQASVSDFCPRAHSGLGRNSTVLFPFQRQALAVALDERERPTDREARIS